MKSNQLIKLIIFELSAAGVSLYDICQVLKMRPSEVFRLYLELSVELEPASNVMIH